MSVTRSHTVISLKSPHSDQKLEYLQKMVRGRQQYLSGKIDSLTRLVNENPGSDEAARYQNDLFAAIEERSLTAELTDDLDG